MPGLPTNAPTTGMAAVIFWSLAGLALVVLAFRFFFPSGSARTRERRARDTDAITILQGQVASLQVEVRGLKREVKRMSLMENWNREYRHALANQANALLAWSEIAYGLFEQIFDDWPECPHHYHKQLQQMKPPAEILKRHPLPSERVVTEEELDDDDA